MSEVERDPPDAYNELDFIPYFALNDERMTVCPCYSPSVQSEFAKSI